MKKLLLILLCLPMIGFGQQTYVPDDSFEVYLEANGMGNGVPNDDYVTTANINSVTGLYIAFQSISDLTGIEDFIALVVLDCKHNFLSSVDVSNNVALTTLTFYNNQLTSLDVSQNTALENLDCESNQLISLDLSQNTALTFAHCASNLLTSLDVSNGNNVNMTLLANGNNNLFCIEVDDVAWSTSNWTGAGAIDTWMSFSTDCSTAFGCTDNCAINYNSLAIIDDSSCVYPASSITITAANNYTWNGVTYTESGIYEVSSSPANIGDYYQGGVIFYLDGNGGGFVSDIADLCNAYWGCPWSLMNTDSWDGEQNTLDILAQCGDPTIAARLCDNSYNQGYSDWYLPAKGQLDDMYDNKIDIDNASLLNNGSIFVTGNYEHYLSSSEYNTTAINNSVWFKIFTNGSAGYTGKSNINQVRAIRNISTIPASISGCDSTAILNLTITNPTAPTVNNTSSLLSTSACDSLTWNGNTYFTSGTYSDTTTYSTGCINIDSLILTINTISNTIEAAGFCSFETINYNWYGVNYTQIGTYTQSLGTTTNGCDSIGTLNIYNLGQNCGCDSVYYYEGDWMMPGNWQLTTNSGTFYQGSDSSGNAIYVNIIVNYSTSNITTVTSCNSYAWPADGNTYSSSGIYTNTYTSIAGCDSTVTLNLTIDSSNTSVTTTACDSFLIGSNYYIVSGSYTDTLTSVNGCDSVVNTNLTIGQNTSSYDTLSVGASIVWNGMPLNVSGDYSVTLINSVGCDSIVNLNLTVTTTGISDIANSKSNLVKITDMLGQETPYRRNTPLFYIYDDGTVEKRIVIE
jgi:hypothetical protein